MDRVDSEGIHRRGRSPVVSWISQRARSVAVRWRSSSETIERNVLCNSVDTKLLNGFKFQPFKLDQQILSRSKNSSRDFWNINMAVKVLGHRLHAILIAFPVGLLGGSLAFDIACLLTDYSRWADISYWLLISGVAGGLVAAPFGSMDWFSIADGTRAKRIGFIHGATAIVSIALFAFSVWLRNETPTHPGTSAIICSFTAGVALMVAGWLGGELVQRMGIGVDAGAHADSPNSLSGRPASGNMGSVSRNMGPASRSRTADSTIAQTAPGEQTDLVPH